MLNFISMPTSSTPSSRVINWDAFANLNRARSSEVNQSNGKADQEVSLRTIARSLNLERPEGLDNLFALRSALNSGKVIEGLQIRGMKVINILDNDSKDAQRLVHHDDPHVELSLFNANVSYQALKDGTKPPERTSWQTGSLDRESASSFLDEFLRNEGKFKIWREASDLPIQVQLISWNPDMNPRRYSQTGSAMSISEALREAASADKKAYEAN